MQLRQGRGGVKRDLSGKKKVKEHIGQKHLNTLKVRPEREPMSVLRPRRACISKDARQTQASEQQAGHP